jgi:hypothetical protein
MIHGELPRHTGRYFLGVFDGDGQNFKNQDNQPAVIGRAFFAPLALWQHHAAWMEEIWVGGSFWWQRNDNLGGGVTPATSGAAQNDLSNFTTQGGFAWLSSSYGNGSDAAKNPIREHLAPAGTTVKYGFDLNVPITRRFGLRSEYVHQSIDLRQYDDVNPGTGNLTRTSNAAANLTGWGAYAEVYGWIGGEVNTDHPGLYKGPHWSGYVPPPPPRWAVQLAAKYEHVEADVSGLPSSTDSKGNQVANPAAGHYALDAFSLGASLWVTRHTRLAANYVLNYIGAGDGNAANEKKNLFFERIEHELLFRLAVQL